MKSLLCVVALAILSGCAQVVPITNGVPIMDGNKQIAVIDPATGKAYYQNGGEPDQVIAALLKHIGNLGASHAKYAEEVEKVPGVKERIQKLVEEEKAKSQPEEKVAAKKEPKAKVKKNTKAKSEADSE